MALVIIGTIGLVWFVWRVRDSNINQIVMLRPEAPTDPFADHPMHCKCIHHR